MRAIGVLKADSVVEIVAFAAVGDILDVEGVHDSDRFADLAHLASLLAALRLI